MAASQRTEVDASRIACLIFTLFGLLRIWSAGSSGRYSARAGRHHDRPAVVSSKELVEVFTPSEGEVAWARSKVRSEAPEQVVALLM